MQLLKIAFSDSINSIPFFEHSALIFASSVD